MKRKITWIRHGQSTWNAEGRWQGHTDAPLSDLGREQAASLRTRLKSKRFDIIFASDLKRALNTGKSTFPDQEIQVDSRLREIKFGIYEGKTSQELSETERKTVNAWWASPYAQKLQGGESMACVNDRINAWMDELPKDCDVAVFSHGGVVRNAVWQIVGPPIDGNWRLSIDNTSLTVIEYTTDRPIIRKINDSAHLEMSSS